MRRSLLLVLALVCFRCAHAPPPQEGASATPAAAPGWPEPRPPALRLSETVRPVSYLLDLKLIPAEPTYSGTVAVDLDVREPVRQLWLHAQDLTVSRARVSVGGRVLDGRVVTEGADRLGVLLPEQLAAGPATLTLDFSGKADRERSQGLYAVEEGGEPYLYTFFEPTDARRAFPCFDEPGFKVPWTLRFTVKAGHVALANHPVVSREPLADGLERVTFAKSRPMPSYLVAFMVGPFDVVEAGTVGRDHVPLRFIVPKGRGGETAYAASVTPRIVQVLEDWFDQTYPYEKLDVAVVPRYWGTMEHPGIVALGQPLTLIRPGEDTLQRRKWYVTIAGHELGHYWFGDVVTCRWWDDIWLNETLTSWLDQKTVQAFDPAWGFGLDRSMGSMTMAFEADALVSASPVRKPASTIDDLANTFDNSTTYAKGSAIIDMFEAWLGEERMRDILRAWIRKHAWGVATTEDFAAHLSEQAGADVGNAFRGYIEQAGVPRITATLKCAPGTPARLTLTQERYLPAGSPGAPEQTWGVPVCARGGGVRAGAPAATCELFTGKTKEMALPFRQCPDWVLLNAGGTGYYRVGYTAEQLDALLATRLDTFTVRERLALIADVEGAVAQGGLPLRNALALVVRSAEDPSRQVRMRGSFLLSLVHEDHMAPEDRKRFRAWVRDVYAPKARALGWVPKSGEDEDTKQARHLLMWRAAGTGQDPALVRQAGQWARIWLKDPSSVPAEVANETLLAVAARDGDPALFDRVLARAREATDRTERSKLLGMLGAFGTPALSQAALGLVLDPGFDVRDTKVILAQAFGGVETRPAAWAFFRDHFDMLAERLRSDDMNGLISQVGELCDASLLAEVESSLTPRISKVEGGPRTLAKVLESIRLCVASERLHEQGVRDFLKSLGSQATPPKSR